MNVMHYCVIIYYYYNSLRLKTGGLLLAVCPINRAKLMVNQVW